MIAENKRKILKEHFLKCHFSKTNQQNLQLCVST